MPPLSLPSSLRLPRLNQGLDRLLLGLSVFWLPVLFGLLTLWALWNWHSPYTAAQGKALNFQVLQDTQGTWQASDAIQKLKLAAPALVDRKSVV